MTLPLNSRLSALYDTNGTQKDFSFGFRVFFDPDNGGYGLEVRRQTADGYEVIPKSDYLVLPVEDNSAGVVRFSVAPSAGQQIYIAGKTPTIQQLVLTNFGRYSAESIETQFDFITAIIQEWLSALGEETRQRIAADDILTQYVVQRIDAFVQQVNQNFDDKSQEIEDYIATIMPSFTQALRDEIEAFAVAGMQDAIDQTLAESKAEINDAVARANAAALAAAITGKLYDTPEAGVDPVTGVQNGAYYNVRAPDDDRFLVEYQNVGGVPTPTGKSYPSSAALNKLQHNNLKGRNADEAHPASAILDKSGLNQEEINDSIVSEVNTLADLKAIKPRKNKQVVFVKSLNTNFIYEAESIAADNGVTIVKSTDVANTGVWEMQIREVYYASWFALPDLSDMSEQIKVGYEYATSKKRTFIIDANFNVKSNQQIPGSPIFTALNVLSNSHAYFLPQGKLTLITDNDSNSNIICAKDVDNYIITRPKLVGDRLTNTATEGSREWGYGLTIYPSSNGYIFEPDIKNCMGDGLYIGKSWAYPTDNVPTKITVVRPKIDRVRRNGISLTSGKNVFVDSPIVSNVTTIDGITPTEPASGLDIEPESAPDYPIARLENCIIHNPTFVNCDKAINFWNQPVGSFMDVRITGETNIYNDSTPHTGLWMRNERACAVGSRLHIDKVVFNSKLDQPILVFIYETSNVDVVIGEMVNNCGQNLDFLYAAVNGVQRFGNFKIGKLSTTNQNFGFTVVYSSLNSGCYTGLRIENVDCKLGAFNLTPVTAMKKTSRYFVNSKAYVFNSMKTNELISSVLQFESYTVTAPTLDTTDDLSLIHISLSPTSPKSNPLSVPNLQILYEGGVYSKITLSSGASMSMKRVGNITEIYELSYGGVIVGPIAV